MKKLKQLKPPKLLEQKLKENVKQLVDTAYAESKSLADNNYDKAYSQGFSAIVKRASAHLMRDAVNHISELNSLDITPTLANQIIKGIRGRGISKDVLSGFSKPGRTAANKSNDFLLKTKIVETYQNTVIDTDNAMRQAIKDLISKERKNDTEKSIFQSR